MNISHFFLQCHKMFCFASNGPKMVLCVRAGKCFVRLYYPARSPGNIFGIYIVWHQAPGKCFGFIFYGAKRRKKFLGLYYSWQSARKIFLVKILWREASENILRAPPLPHTFSSNFVEKMVRYQIGGGRVNLI